MSSYSNQTTRYEAQLPKKSRCSWTCLFQYLSNFCSIIAIIIIIFIPQEARSVIYPLTLVALVAFVLIHAYISSYRKLHRFSNATIYVHYINHIIRDSLASKEVNNFSDVKEILQKIVDAIANCFSLLVGKQCRCTIKELHDDLTVKTIVRDSISKERLHLCDAQDQKAHLIEENTDFYNLWYSLEGCSRYFFSNNLLKLYKRSRYKNSSFKLFSEPNLIEILGFSFIRKWTLPYKSTIESVPQT